LNGWPSNPFLTFRVQNRKPCKLNAPVVHYFMVKAIDIRKKIRSDHIYEDVVKQLDPYKKKPLTSVVFLVDSSPDRRVKILIKYPGKKVRQRAGRIPWANLYDFLVIPVYNNKELPANTLQWRNLGADFYDHKKQSREFWTSLEHLYRKNEIDFSKIPKLDGMNPTLFLLLIKWMWVQEDLNYKYCSKDIQNCPSEYRNETKNGSPTKGAGRGKFYAGLLLVKFHGFPPYEVARIIP